MKCLRCDKQAKLGSTFCTNLCKVNYVFNKTKSEIPVQNRLHQDVSKTRYGDDLTLDNLAQQHPTLEEFKSGTQHPKIGAQ